MFFTGENYDLSQAARPRHRVQRFETILKQWARRLPTDVNYGRTDEHHENRRADT